MQRDLRSLAYTSTESQYVANELAGNIVKNKEKGEVEVNGSEVISEVVTIQGIQIAQKIDRARQVIEDKHNGKLFEKHGRGGFGFISILEAGWDIDSGPCPTGFRIHARRKRREETEVAGSSVRCSQESFTT
jgi:hypothetical protein